VEWGFLDGEHAYSTSNWYHTVTLVNMYKDENRESAGNKPYLAIAHSCSSMAYPSFSPTFTCMPFSMHHLKPPFLPVPSAPM
jgi:hypothetical protein